MPSGMKIVKPLPSPTVLNANIKRKIQKRLTPLAKKNAQAKNRIVSGWQPQNRPRFSGVVKLEPTATVLIVEIVNSEKPIANSPGVSVGTLWIWWEKTGTKRHKDKIRPVRAKALRFIIGSEVIFAMSVQHPGTKPKKVTPIINKQTESQIDPILRISVKEGMWP